MQIVWVQIIWPGSHKARVRIKQKWQTHAVLSTTDVIGLISALGVGSVIGGIVTQLLSRRSEKRQLRAKISEELSAVRALSPPVNDSQAQIKREDELVAAQVRLRSAAMLAHLPRKLVEGYSRLTAAALHSSKESLAANGRGSVPGAVAECLDAAHQLMSDLLWQPVRTRIRYPFRFWWLRRRVTQTS